MVAKVNVSILFNESKVTLYVESEEYVRSSTF